MSLKPQPNNGRSFGNVIYISFWDGKQLITTTNLTKNKSSEQRHPVERK